jgi:hypothetical protein
MPTLLERPQAPGVDGSLPFPPPIHSHHLIPHTFISGAAYHGIRKHHILHAQIPPTTIRALPERAIQA